MWSNKTHRLVAAIGSIRRAAMILGSSRTCPEEGQTRAGLRGPALTANTAAVGSHRVRSGRTVVLTLGTAVTSIVGFAVAFRIHGSVFDALIAFALRAQISSPGSAGSAQAAQGEIPKGLTPRCGRSGAGAKGS